MIEAKLENWFRGVPTGETDPETSQVAIKCVAPNDSSGTIFGEVYDHPAHKDGAPITIEAVEGHEIGEMENFEECTLILENGERFKLGTPALECDRNNPDSNLILALSFPKLQKPKLLPDNPKPHQTPVRDKKLASIPILEHWYCTTTDPDKNSYITGRGYNYPKVKDGTPNMYISFPVSRTGNIVTTSDGKKYELGNPHPDYDKEKAAAILNSIPEIKAGEAPAPENPPAPPEELTP